MHTNKYKLIQYYLYDIALLVVRHNCLSNSDNYAFIY